MRTSAAAASDDGPPGASQDVRGHLRLPGRQTADCACALRTCLITRRPNLHAHLHYYLSLCMIQV